MGIKQTKIGVLYLRVWIYAKQRFAYNKLHAIFSEHLGRNGLAASVRRENKCLRIK
jgi:hypothetical protein